MILQRERSFLRQNFIFYLAGILVVLGIKVYYSHADCDSLLWILAPTTHWVELLSGIPFTYVSGTGYVNHSLRLWIAPSCSGVRFMIITVAMLIFSFVHSIASPEDDPAPKASVRIMRGFGWIAVSIIFSWLFTVFVNGLRIITAIFLPMYLERAGLMNGLLTADRLHTMIGVVVYFIALLMLYRIGAYLIRKKGSLIGPPVFWYFFMTVGLPLFNRAYRSGTAEFMEYAVLIICCLTLILLPYCLMLLLRGQRRNKG